MVSEPHRGETPQFWVAPYRSDESSNPEQASAITMAELTPGSKVSFEEKRPLMLRP